MKYGSVILVCMTMLFCTGVFAQDEDEVIRIETELINVPLTVTDKAGKPLLDLKRSNFTVFEDGKPQEIAEFSSTAAPFEVALLLDTSGSTRSDLELIKRSARNFIESLRPGDRVAIISFITRTDGTSAYAESEVLNRLTDDRAVLRDALERMSTSNGTPYYDGLIKVAEDIFSDPPAPENRGRRALVALTDGVDSVSATEFAEAFELLTAADIASYFIRVNTRDFFEENLLGDCEMTMRFSAAQIRRYYRQFDSSNVERVSGFCQLGDFERLAVSKALYELANREMAQLAEKTGGKVFPVADLSGSRNAFRNVAAEIGTKYSLAYYPSNETRDGKFRKIEVKLENVPAGSKVTAREGYVAN